VHVAAKDPLRQLAQQGRLYRRECQGRYLYCAAERGLRQQQWAARQARKVQRMICRRPSCSSMVCWTNNNAASMRAGKLGVGHGGDQRMARLFGLDVDTVARAGRSCCAVKSSASGCVRWEAADRGSKKNARPLEPTAAFAPRPHRRGSDGTAGPLDGLALGADQRKIGGTGPLGLSQHGAAFAGGVGLCAARQSQEPLRFAQSERDRQFRYLQSQRQQFSRQGLPIISVDSKKKELVGPFKNGGRLWSQEGASGQRPRFSLAGQGGRPSPRPL